MCLVNSSIKKSLVLGSTHSLNFMVVVVVAIGVKGFLSLIELGASKNKGSYFLYSLMDF